MSQDDSSSFKQLLSTMGVAAKLITAILSLSAFALSCVAFGKQLGRLDSLETSVEIILSKLDSFVGEGNRHTHEDAVDQRNRSFELYVKDPNSFWLAEPIHKDRNPSK